MHQTAEPVDKPAAPAKSKATKMLSFLSKNVKSVNFQNLPFSPGREKRAQHHAAGKAFSGPIISMIPAKSKSGRRYDADQEPTSPKISCMGQIKHKKKSNKSVAPRPPTNNQHPHPPPPQNNNKKNKKENDPWARRPKSAAAAGSDSDFLGPKPARKSADVRTESAAAPPGLGGMKKFASSRDGKLAEFDWNKDYSSEDEDEVLVPHSAPMMIGGGVRVPAEPRQEINLWKRRTMDPPKPLQLNSLRPS